MNKPFSVAIKSNNNLYVSGQVGIDKATGKLVSDGVIEQLQTIFLNLTSLLNEHNLVLDNIIVCNIFLTNMNDYTAMNEEYVKHFTKRLPTRTCVAVSALPLNAKIELTIIAECNE